MKLRKLLGVFSPHWREPGACPGCGGPFACGFGLRGCWCSEIKLSDAARADLKARYTGCLCRACLERAALAAENVE